MLWYSVLLEILIFVIAGYNLKKKRGDAFFCLPAIFFTRTMIHEPLFRAIFYYLLVTYILCYAVWYYRNSIKFHLPILILFGYFIFLYATGSNPIESRPYFFSMIWFFTFLLFLPAIYRKHDQKYIFSQIYATSYLIIVLFVCNVLVSTLTGYNVTPMYGFNDGVLYGALFASNFMVIPVAFFIVLLKNLQKLSLINLVLLVLTLAFIFLTMRRMVILTLVLSLFCVMIIYFYQHKIKKITKIVFLGSIFIMLLISFSDLHTMLMARFEIRSQTEINLIKFEQEGRFLDHTLVYQDAFIKNDFNPFFGYDFFNSRGNYGGGVLGNRPLHADIPVIMHSSGLIGVFLYLTVTLKFFYISYKNSKNKMELWICIFCLLVFILNTVTGRITEGAYSSLLFMLVLIPLSCKR